MKRWAREQGAHLVTAHCWLRAGKPPLPARRVGGLTLVEDQRPDLDPQVARGAAWAAREGLSVGRIVTEIGSALHGRGRRSLARLRDPSVTTIVVEHRDRFARFGSE